MHAVSPARREAAVLGVGLEAGEGARTRAAAGDPARTADSTRALGDARTHDGEGTERTVFRSGRCGCGAHAVCARPQPGETGSHDARRTGRFANTRSYAV